MKNTPSSWPKTLLWSASLLSFVLLGMNILKSLGLGLLGQLIHSNHQSPEILMILESQFGKGMLHQLGGNLSSLLARKGSLIGIFLITPILFGMIFWYTSRNSDSK